jgi:6-carboxyhexanoate--CoA ligase
MVSEHISGAERLTSPYTLNEISTQFINRAISHDKGIPDVINLKIEFIPAKSIIRQISLPVFSFRTNNHAEADTICTALLMKAGISPTSIKAGIGWVNSGNLEGRAFSGAFIMDRSSSQVLNPEMKPVRATTMDYTLTAHAQIDEILIQNGLAGTRLKEALVLATKVAHAPSALAEFCLSDNPGYHTGYVALTGIGYFRIPFLKKRQAVGGRIFFVDGQNFNWDTYSRYMRETAVLIDRISPVYTDIIPGEIDSLLNKYVHSQDLHD